MADYSGTDSAVPAYSASLGSFPASEAVFGKTDHALPTVTNLSPSAGTPVTRSQVISFTVSDNVRLASLVVLAEYPQQPEGTTVKEVVWDGAFEVGYRGTSNTVFAYTNGYDFTVLRDGGWPASAVTIRAFAVDTAGNVAA